MEAATQMESRSAQETFSVTLARLREQDRTKIDVVLNTRDHVRMIAAGADGEVTPRLLTLPALPQIGEREIDVLEHAHRQMASRSKVPWKFYDRLRTDHPDILANTMTKLWEREPKQQLLRTFDNGWTVARAWLSDRYRVVDNLPFLTAALEEAERHGAEVRSANVDDTRLYVKLVTQEHADLGNLIQNGRHEFLKDGGDPVRAGVIIRNSEVGDGKISVAPYIERLLCWNGLISAQQYAKIHLGGSLDDGVQSAITQVKESEYIFSAVQDWIRYALAPENLREVVEAFRRAAAVRIDSSAKIAVANVARYGGLTKQEADGVLERYLRADNDNQFTLVNAVTEQAHRGSDSYRRQVEMEELGGQLLAMEERTFARTVQRGLTDKELSGAFSAN